MKHDVVAREEVIEAASLKPSGAMPGNADDKSEVKIQGRP